MEVVSIQPDYEVLHGLYYQEEALCKLLLNHGNEEYEFEIDGETVNETVAEHIISELVSDKLDFKNELFQSILDQFIQTYDQEERILDSDTILRNENSELVTTVVNLLSEKYFLHNWESKKIYPQKSNDNIEEATRQSVFRFKQKRIVDLLEDIHANLKELDEYHPNREEKLQMIMRLTELKNKIRKELGGGV